MSTVAIATTAGALSAFLATGTIGNRARQRRASIGSSRFTAPTRASRRRSQPATTAADWARLLDTVAAEVRSGTALREAWDRGTAKHGARGTVVAPERTLEETVALVAADRDEAVVAHVAAAAMSLGGPVAATLDSGAALLRERAAARADAAAQAAQARLSATVLTAVPVVFAAWSAMASDAFRDGISSPPGAASVVIGALLNAGGWRWMRSLVRRAAP